VALTSDGLRAPDAPTEVSLTTVHFGPRFPAVVSPVAPWTAQAMGATLLIIGWGAACLMLRDGLVFGVAIAGLVLGLVSANVATWPRRVSMMVPSAIAGPVVGAVTALLFVGMVELFTEDVNSRPFGLIGLLVGSAGLVTDWRMLVRVRLTSWLSAVGALAALFGGTRTVPWIMLLWLAVLAAALRSWEVVEDRASWRLPSLDVRRASDLEAGRGRLAAILSLVLAATAASIIFLQLKVELPDVTLPASGPNVRLPWLTALLEALGRLLPNLTGRFPRISLPHFDLPFVDWPWLEDFRFPTIDLELIVKGFAILVLLGLVALAVVPLVLWLTRRAAVRRARPWGIRFAERVGKAGARRGCTRARGESLERYLDVLQRSALPDPRLSGVGTLVSAVLFAPADGVAAPPHTMIGTIDQTFTAVLRDHPLWRRWLTSFRATVAGAWSSLRNAVPFPRDRAGANGASPPPTLPVTSVDGGPTPWRPPLPASSPQRRTPDGT